MNFIITIITALRTFSAGLFPVIVNFVFPALDIVNKILDYVEGTPLGEWQERTNIKDGLFNHLLRTIRKLAPELSNVKDSEVISAFAAYLKKQPEPRRNALVFKLGSFILMEIYKDKKKNRKLSEREADLLIQLGYVSRKDNRSIG